LIVALAVFSLFLFNVGRHAWVCDDAYITFRTVDNFIQGRGLTWNAGYRVQAYTHPLWMFLLSFGGLFHTDPFYVSIVLGALLSLCTGYLLLFRVAQNLLLGVLGLALLASSSAFVDYSTSGLENPLTHLLLVVAFLLGRGRDGSRRRIAPFAAAASLIYLSRPDALLLLVFVFVLLAYRPVKRGYRRRTVLKALVIGGLPFVAWEIFSLFYYGFPFPNTAYAKMGARVPREQLLQMGVGYYEHMLEVEPAMLLTIALAVLLGLMGDKRLRPWGLGLIAYLGFIAWIGGDFMQGRMLTPPLLLSVMLLVSTPVRAIPRAPLLRTCAMTLLVGYSLTQSNSPWGAHEGSFAHRLIDDERSSYREFGSLEALSKSGRHPYEGHVYYNRANALLRSGAKVSKEWNVGVLGYRVGANVHLIDQLALGDPLLARLPTLRTVAYRPGHYPRYIPEGYAETIATGEDRFSDRQLGAYYAHLRRVVAGDLLSLNRLSDIVAFNLGRYDHLIDVDRYRFALRVEVRADRLKSPREAGSPWNAPGNVLFKAAGLDVLFDQLQHGRHIELTVDNNDRHAIMLLRGDRQVAEDTIEPTPEPGLAKHVVEFPSDAAGQGYDRVRLLPLEGDARYSIGHLVVLP
jgi:arabinofuranosyltransferase